VGQRVDNEVGEIKNRKNLSNLLVRGFNRAGSNPRQNKENSNKSSEENLIGRVKR
jgi:hypothetical protein